MHEWVVNCLCAHEMIISMFISNDGQTILTRDTRKVTSNSLGIDFIDGYIRGRPCGKLYGVRYIGR